MPRLPAGAGKLRPGMPGGAASAWCSGMRDVRVGSLDSMQRPLGRYAPLIMFEEPLCPAVSSRCTLAILAA